ncbi:unnamed protein product, partial [Heterotrigona itama]
YSDEYQKSDLLQSKYLISLITLNEFEHLHVVRSSLKLSSIQLEHDELTLENYVCRYR